jgi:ABC-type nitrate/sulfonate/bicarbonate transport system permease component
MTQLTQTTAAGLVTDDIALPARKPPERGGFFGSRRFTQIASIVVGLGLWELAARFAIHNTAFLAPPSLVAIRGWQMILDGTLLYNGWVSLQELIIGFILGVVAGIAIGAAMVQWKPVNDALEVWISALYAAPIVALAPILIIWFGFGTQSKVAVVFIMVVFPMVICTQAGLESVDRRLLLVARSFCGSRWKTFRTVALPSAAPFIVSGMRQSVGRALVGVVVGELFGAKAGLGNIITTASSVFDMPTLFVAVVTLALAGVILTGILRKLELRLAAWRDVA